MSAPDTGAGAGPAADAGTGRDSPGQARLRQLAEEQAALRRVATLVAGGARPAEVFSAVADELGRLIGAEATFVSRFDQLSGERGEIEGYATVVGSYGRVSDQAPVGFRRKLHPGMAMTAALRTGGPARISGDMLASGPFGEVVRGLGLRAAMAMPIVVEGRYWGVAVAATVRADFPPGTESRMTEFTEMVATAVANAQNRRLLEASRDELARLLEEQAALRRVATLVAGAAPPEAVFTAGAEEVGRLLEVDYTVLVRYDPHDAIAIVAAWTRTGAAAPTPVGRSPPASAGELAAQMDLVAGGLTGVLAELREIARGIHPAALAEGGLRRALKTLARRSAVPVRLNAGVDGRLPEPIELAAYYVVAEALTNTAKHASAAIIDVQVEISAGGLHVRIRDDGRGGADLTSGTGLLGLTDRVEALGGRLSLHSPPGAGTTVHMVLPLTAPGSCP